MSFKRPDCDDIALYLTEYQRGQLPKAERQKVDEHLMTCIRCEKENKVFENLSLELDKIIPSVSGTYEQNFVYNLFIRTREENILIKILSLSIVLGLLFFIFSGIFYPQKDYASIKDLKVRAENMFNEDYYSGKKTVE